MGDDPTVAVPGLSREIPGTWPGAGPSGPFAGFPNAAEDDPSRLEITRPWDEGEARPES